MKMPKLRGNNLGRGVSLFVQWVEHEAAMHEDIDAWGAASECHNLVSRNEGKRYNRMRRHVEGVTGLKWRVFVEECKRRTGNFRWMYHRYGVTL